jgi:hypothetical protein
LQSLRPVRRVAELDSLGDTMKTHCILWPLMLLMAAFCLAGEGRGTAPILTKQEEVAKHVGHKVTIVGVVSNTKMPQILGVDVASDTPDLRGKKAEATGILERYEMTAAQIKEMDRDGIAHRGAGVFYRLRDEKRNTEAQARQTK